MSKLKLFIKGRIGQFAEIEKACKGCTNIVWVHAASYGEFEEACPVISRIRETHPEMTILATFFSPSGYVAHKNNPLADWVFYLPIDTPGNARRFLDTVRPVKVIFSISDYWLFFLKELRKRHIDTYLISGRFVPGMSYFGFFGKPYRTAFTRTFTKMMVRDRQSSDLLHAIGVKHAPVIGDPRMDRVISIASEQWSDPIIQEWSRGAKVFVAGSTLAIGDDDIISALINAHPDDRFIVVPHEIGAKDIAHIRTKVNGNVALYSAIRDGKSDIPEEANVLIIDTVGMLSRIYRYGFAAYVGGGFDGSPHSVVEAAVYGIPVSYGPQFGSHYHCQALIDRGGGIAVRNADELCGWYDSIRNSPERLDGMGKAAHDYCYEGAGAADAILKEIF